MRFTRATGYLTTLCATALLAGCGDQQLLGPELAGPMDPSLATVTVCETIDFNQFAHGDIVTEISVLGMSLTLDVTGYLWLTELRPSIPSVVRTYDTNNVGGPDPDLESTAECPGCAGLGRVLVLEDARSWVGYGDDNVGGTITLTGFTEDVFIQSWKAIDNDANEEPFLMEVHDGNAWTLASQSSSLGHGTVETVASPQQLFDTALRFTLGRGVNLGTGSGAIDDLVLCKEEEVPNGGGDGCTLGYWKTHSSLAPGNQDDAWIPTGYTVSTLLSSVFAMPAALNDLNGDGSPDNLYDALNYGGGGGVAGGARVLLKQAVAALLNSSHPGVEYGMTKADVIAEVNAALASGSRNAMIALGEELDTLNNAGCTLN